MGRELEDEAFQVCRFIYGIRAELRTYCSIRTFNTVSELVERMAMLETNLADEAKLKSRPQSSPVSKTNDQKRKWDQVEGGKASSDKHEFPKCGRRHPGDAGRSWGLVFEAAAWIRQSGTALDQGQPRADQVEAALRLVSIVASLGTSRRNVRSCRRDKERAVQTLVGQTRVGRPQLLGCTSCPRTTTLMDRTSRS